MDNETKLKVAETLRATAEALHPQPQDTIQAMVDAIHSGDPAAITASSLGRIAQHVSDLQTNSFVIISAFRKEFSQTENLTRTQALQQDIRSLGFGYNRLIGHWLECQDTDVPYNECAPDRLVETLEMSMFVIDMKLKDGMRLCSSYSQDAFIYGGPDSDGIVKVFGPRGEVFEVLGPKLTTQKIKQGFSALRNDPNRKFSFVGVGVDSPMTAMAATGYEKSRYGTSKFHAVWGQR